MTTGTIQSASLTLSPHKETYQVFLTLTNDSGGVLTAGQEVTINGDLTVDKRDAGTEFPLGVVSVGGADEELITVATVLQRTLKAVATGGAFTAGALVKPNGVKDSAGRPQYVAIAATDYASAVVLQGASQNAEALLGVLRAPFQTNV